MNQLSLVSLSWVELKKISRSLVIEKKIQPTLDQTHIDSTQMSWVGSLSLFIIIYFFKKNIILTHFI